MPAFCDLFLVVTIFPKLRVFLENSKCRKKAVSALDERTLEFSPFSDSLKKDYRFSCIHIGLLFPFLGFLFKHSC